VYRLVEVAEVIVPLDAVKACSVVEPTTKRSPTPLNEEVAVRPKKALPVLKRVVEA